MSSSSYSTTVRFNLMLPLAASEQSHSGRTQSSSSAENPDFRVRSTPPAIKKCAQMRLGTWGSVKVSRTVHDLRCGLCQCGLFAWRAKVGIEKEE